jgi:hypothetical protein
MLALIITAVLLALLALCVVVSTIADRLVREKIDGRWFMDQFTTHTTER